MEFLLVGAGRGREHMLGQQGTDRAGLLAGTREEGLGSVPGEAEHKTEL